LLVVEDEIIPLLSDEPGPKHKEFHEEGIWPLLLGLLLLTSENFNNYSKNMFIRKILGPWVNLKKRKEQNKRSDFLRSKRRITANHWDKAQIIQN
jgi:hypothetical protein